MADMENNLNEVSADQAENETLEPVTEETPDELEDKPGRIFTQEELTRIVERKIAKERKRKDNAFLEREQQLAQREMRVEARELLADSGLPADLLSALNLSDKETMQQSIKTMQKYFGVNVNGGYHPKRGEAPVKTDPVKDAFKPPKL